MEPDIKTAIAELRDWLTISNDMGEATPRLTSAARTNLLVLVEYAAQTEALRDGIQESLSGFSTIDPYGVLVAMSNQCFTADQSATSLFADEIRTLSHGRSPGNGL